MMKLRRYLLAAAICAGPLFAQDPPSRVARLNWFDGRVSFQPATLDTWTGATVNYPLTTGDHIYTDASSRAEIHIGANAMRLDQQSNFGFLNLDDRTVQMRFTEGALEVRLRRLNDDDLYEVDTPQGAISLLRAGEYRIDTDPSRNATMVTVQSGEVEVTANGQSFPVHPRQTAYFSGDNAPDIRDANEADDFDRFTSERNRREEQVRHSDHVPMTMAGYEDLDAYGSWRQEPDYGWVWAPPVRAGWAPYRNGRWAWVEPWGWTWIDDAPWGFAPFHYGRWAFIGGGWGWVPGPVAVRPVYAPALVAFVGGSHFSLSVGVGGGGGVAWFPLGPREVYRPAYHVSNTYVRNVNVTNVTNINNTSITNTSITNTSINNTRYVNQTVPGAVTAVNRQAFVNSQPVHQVAQAYTPQQAAQAQVLGTAPQIAPQRQSVLGNARMAGNVPRPSQTVMAREVVAKATPPPAPVSFQAKQQALEQSQGRPLGPQEIQSIRARQPQAAQSFRGPVRSSAATVPGFNPRPGNARPGIPEAQPNQQTREVQTREEVVGRPSVQSEPANRGQFARPQTTATPAPVNNAPVFQPRPAERMDARPPSARPLNGGASPQNAPRPDFTRPAPQAQPQAPARPEFNRPAPQPRPANVPPPVNRTERMDREPPHNRETRQAEAPRGEAHRETPRQAPREEKAKEK